MHQNAQDWQIVARFSEMDDPGSYGFQLDCGEIRLFGFVVRRGDELYAYENECPHMGRMLNWGPHRFLTRDQSLIMCAAHGALFEIATGMCAGGPCMGESLRSLPVRAREGDIEVNVARFVRPVTRPDRER